MTRAEIRARLDQEYAKRRADAERDREERVRLAVERDPQIGQIQQQMRRLLAQAAREVMNRREEAHAISDALRAQISALRAEISSRLLALGLPRDQLEMRYACDACRDSGYVGELKNQECECRRRRRLQLMRESANLSAHAGETFDQFDPGVFPEGAQRAQAERARDLCAAYAGALPGGAKQNLVLMGASGLGKTFLLGCVADRAIARGVDALCITAFRMVEAMRAYHFGQEDADAPLERLLNCELLLIDDLGAEPMLRNITVEYLYMLINERGAAGRNTLIATNLSPAEIQERYGARILSRLMDRRRGIFIHLEGQDVRYLVANRQPNAEEK